MQLHRHTDTRWTRRVCTLSSDLLTSGSMHAEDLPRSISIWCW